MNTVCIFDIETVPDIESIAKLDNIDLTSVSQNELFDYALMKRRGEVGNEFMRHHLHKIVAISLVLVQNDKIKCASIGELEDDEKTIVERFFQVIEHYRPQLVSWNGSGFDLPVLHYRALMHGVSAPTYWDVGHFDNNSKWNNYLSRFQWQHIDLMDVLAGFQARTNAPLNDIAKLCGAPGKLTTDGGDVLVLYRNDKIADIRHYCETDVLNTYLVYLRFEQMRGMLNDNQYQQSLSRLADYLTQQNKPHFNEFLSAWSP